MESVLYFLFCFLLLKMEKLHFHILKYVIFIILSFLLLKRVFKETRFELKSKKYIHYVHDSILSMTMPWKFRQYFILLLYSRKIWNKWVSHVQNIYSNNERNKKVRFLHFCIIFKPFVWKSVLNLRRSKRIWWRFFDDTTRNALMYTLFMEIQFSNDYS